MDYCFNSKGAPDSALPYKLEIQVLINKGIQFLENLSTSELTTIVATDLEYGINSSLHRGSHHPSLVYDIVVGNTTRGRISKKPTAEKTTHLYHYNQVHELFRVDTIYQNKVAYTEWIQKYDDGIYGFTIDFNGRLSAVCKECFSEGRIISYTLVNCVYNGHEYVCFGYLNEIYQYDIQGLYRSQFIKFVPQSAYLIHRIYEFERKDGYLVSFFELSDTNQITSNRHRIAKKRKA